MKKHNSILLFFVLMTFGLQGQTMKQYKKAINEAFAKQEYHIALQHLDEIQKIDSTNMDLQYKQAEAARLFNAFILAEKRYKQVLASEDAPKYKEADFWLASVQKMQGKYDDAIANFNKYLTTNPDTTQTISKDALAQIQACKWAKELIKFKDKDLEIKQLGEEVNTTASDFAPVKYQDKLLFSSLRFSKEFNKTDPYKKYSKILQLKDGESSAEPFDLGYGDKEIHTAHITVNGTDDRMFFNICEYTDGSIIKCKIFYKDKVGDLWGESVELPAYINAEKMTTTQPNIGFVEELGTEVLFFASDRVGGKGGKDIWYSPLDENGLPEQPKNLYSINTEKEDITPFFHEYSQSLYFSSEGRKSLGGHDIYKSTFKEGNWSEPEHTGYPLNTSYNDVYFSLNKNGSEGFFASNREGTKFLEEDISACCNDIFQAEFNSFILDLRVLSFLEIDGQNEDLAGVTVTLYEIFDNAEKTIAYKIKPEGNQHFYRINSNKKYRIVAEKLGLISGTVEFNTDDAIPDIEIVKEVILKKPVLQTLTFEGNLETALNGVTVALNELDKNGNIIATIPLKSAADNSTFFPIEVNKYYQITASKDGYVQVIDNFNTLNLSKINPILIKKLILEKKPEEETPLVLRNLKPFPLYFDNDYPNPRSRDTVTEFTFPVTLAEYKRKKQQFKEGYSKGLKGEQKIMAEYEVEKFFENEMDATYKEFIKFTDAVLKRLEFGRDVVISVSAYTSPLASKEYNLRLSKRRISSMLNFYRTYKNGAMEKYVDDGKLTIEMIPLGESASPNSISDNPMDRKNSVFSLEASKQRKVEIREVETKRTKSDNSTSEIE